MIYWQISFEKYVPKHLIILQYFLSSLFNNFKKPILKTYPPKVMILNAGFALKLSNYRSLKRFICLKWILKKFCAILQSQFIHHTLPVTPFKCPQICRYNCLKYKKVLQSQYNHHTLPVTPFKCTQIFRYNCLKYKKD